MWQEALIYFLLGFVAAGWPAFINLFKIYKLRKEERQIIEIGNRLIDIKNSGGYERR